MASARRGTGIRRVLPECPPEPQDIAPRRRPNGRQRAVSCATMSRTQNRTEAKRAKVVRILRKLERAHGKRTWRSSGPCLDELAYAMLSQNTNLSNADSGYRQLRRRFPTWTQ